MACRAAVKANDKSAGFELESLVEIVRQDSDVRYCPHGRPVSAKISKHEIVADGVTKTSFDNGVSVLINHTDSAKNIEGKELAEKSFVILG